MRLFVAVSLVVFLFSFPLLSISQNSGELASTIDPDATKQTRALYTNLKKISKNQLIFGHQDALAYGVLWKDWHKSRSDVKDVCGSHPALVGWELSKLGKSEVNIDSVDFKKMKGWIREVYKMGGINAISWHMDNFMTGGNSWDVGEKVVASILPGGEHHQAYLTKLDLFADFVGDLKVGFLVKKEIPIIFRPFHEHTGSWFWWGENHCTPEEYVALWRFTVEYLRDQKNLHNIIWCYSSDVVGSREEYLKKYPGDEYVDVLGLDDYHDLGKNGNSASMVQRLEIIVQLAEEKNKVAALTETGQESIPEAEWWTQRLLNPIKSSPTASQIAYVMVWRNARKNHHYGPYPDHPSNPDFLKFSQDPFVILQNKLPDMYRISK